MGSRLLVGLGANSAALAGGTSSGACWASDAWEVYVADVAITNGQFLSLRSGRNMVTVST